MKAKIGDLKLKDGVAIREIYNECENHSRCEECPYCGDSDHCASVMMETEIEIPQTAKQERWEYDKNADDYNIGGLTKPERARTGYERVDNEEKYYAHGMYVSPIRCESDDERDEIHFFRGDYVNDKYLFYDRDRAHELHNRLEQWQALNDKPVNWGNNNKPKFEIRFDYQENRLAIVADFVYRVANTVYFSTYKKAEEAIDVFRNELMWYYTEYRSRLDEKRKGVA